MRSATARPSAADPANNPHGLPYVEVEYAPSSLDSVQDAQIVIADPRRRISDWTYIVTGRGDAPSVMEPVVVFSAVRVRASAKTTGPTGVEMEALTAASVALLTVYDMCKAVTHDMTIREVGLEEKTGGQRGDFKRT